MLSSQSFRLYYSYSVVKQVAVIPEISVPVSMLIGTAIGIIAVRPNVTEAVKNSSAVLAMVV